MKLVFTNLEQEEVICKCLNKRKVWVNNLTERQQQNILE